MRGVVSAGSGLALQSHLQETMPFDRSDDTSAGTYHWCYFVSGNGTEATSVYYEDLTRGFISLKNIARKRRLVDLSVLTRTVSEGPKAIDFDRVISSEAEAYFYATSASDARKIRLHVGKAALGREQELDEDSITFHCQDKEDILTAMEGSAHLPWYAGPPVRLGDDLFLVDGGLSAGRVPLHEAIDAGCTHVLVLATDKSPFPDHHRRSNREKLAARFVSKEFPELAQRYWDGHDYHLEVLEALATNNTGGVIVDVVRPDERYIPSQIETNPKKLFYAAKAGEAAMLEALKPFGLKRNPWLAVRAPRPS